MISRETIWIFQRNCEDYYCGCGGGHIVGVFHSRAEIDEITQRVEREWTARFGPHPYFDWKITEVPIGEYKWNPDDYDQSWT